MKGKMYKYGEEISYDFSLLRAEDFDNLQLFTCGNKRLDLNLTRKYIMTKNQKIHQPQRNIIILVMKFLQMLFHNAEIDTFILEFEKITFYTVNR